MTVQIYNAEQIELLRSIFPDKERYAQFAYNVNAGWYDYPLNDPVNGNHFNDNDGSFPQGWTEVTAPQFSTTNERYGFWYLVGNGTFLNWKYRKQLDYNVEADSADGDWLSFEWGPVLFRDGQWAGTDVEYRLGVYADNAGAIDEDTFVRTALMWNSATQVWRVRHERKDGTTQTNGAWFNLSAYPVVQPVFIRNVLRYFAAGTNEGVRSYIGATPVSQVHTQLTNSIMNDTWGQVWAQAQMTRSGAGVQDYLFLGGIDRTNAP